MFEDGTKDTARELSVGQMAARSGVAVSALHYYEAEGLIQSSRTAAGHRRYHRRELRRVAVIRIAQALGLSLASIRIMLDEVPKDRSVSRADWQAASEAWREALDDRIENLLRLRDQLDRCIGCGCLSLESCPLSNPNDRLASCGSGARRWTATEGE